MHVWIRKQGGVCHLSFTDSIYHFVYFWGKDVSISCILKWGKDFFYLSLYISFNSSILNRDLQCTACFLSVLVSLILFYHPFQCIYTEVWNFLFSFSFPLFCFNGKFPIFVVSLSTSLKSLCGPSVCRDYRPSKAALFDSIEEGGIRVSSSYSQEIDECSNDSAINSLQDRVFFLKRLTGDMQWRAITVGWTGWAMRWMHQGESCLEL